MKYIYRVQNKYGLGPYNTEAPQEVNDIAYNSRSVMTYNQPDVEFDFKPEQLALLGDEERESDWLFGFETRQDAVNWFTLKGIRKLARYGFIICKVLAEIVYRSISGKQIMFLPTKTKLKRKIGCYK